MDPRCKCQVETQFNGELSGDVIDGTYTTHIAGMNHTGHWSVYRKK